MRLLKVLAAVTPLLLSLPPFAMAEDGGGGGDCQSLIPPGCLEALGAGARAIPREASNDCSERFLAYRNCLARSVAAAPPPPQSGAVGCGPEDARQLWPGLENSANIADLETFAQFCQGTVQGQLAANRAERLQAGAASSASPSIPQCIPRIPQLFGDRRSGPASGRAAETLRFAWPLGRLASMRRVSRAYCGGSKENRRRRRSGGAVYFPRRLSQL